MTWTGTLAMGFHRVRCAICDRGQLPASELPMGVCFVSAASDEHVPLLCDGETWKTASRPAIRISWSLMVVGRQDMSVCNVHSPKSTSSMADGNHQCDSDFDLLVGVASYGETITHALLIPSLLLLPPSKHAHSGTQQSSRHDSRRQARY